MVTVMSELPITQRYYHQSVLISGLINAVKQAGENKSITDTHFSPVIKGYDISFKKASADIRMCVKCRKFSGGCVVKIFTHGKKTGRFVIKTKADAEACVKNVIE